MEYDLGLRLKELREKKRLTQEQVGRFLEVSGANISNYESNVVTLPIEAVKRLALLYGVTTDYILGLEKRKVYVIEAGSEYQQKKMEQLLSLLEDIIRSTDT